MVAGGVSGAAGQPKRRGGGVARAEGIVAEELRRAGWEEGRLGSTAKGHPVKVWVALRLRRETRVSHEWIAGRLRMGRRSHASNLVYAKQRWQ
jgi:hypothetical protein